MYVRFPLSLRKVEDLLFERGIDLCHEIVRMWWNRFGPMFAGDIRRQRVSRMRGFRQWRCLVTNVGSRSKSRSSTFRKLSGNRTYPITTRWATSGEKSGYRKGLTGFQGRGMGYLRSPPLPIGAITPTVLQVR